MNEYLEKSGYTEAEALAWLPPLALIGVDNGFPPQFEKLFLDVFEGGIQNL
jgi:hypothetical protein